MENSSCRLLCRASRDPRRHSTSSHSERAERRVYWNPGTRRQLATGRLSCSRAKTGPFYGSRTGRWPDYGPYERLYTPMKRPPRLILHVSEPYEVRVRSASSELNERARTSTKELQRGMGLRWTYYYSGSTLLSAVVWLSLSYNQCIFMIRVEMQWGMGEVKTHKSAYLWIKTFKLELGCVFCFNLEF